MGSMKNDELPQLFCRPMKKLEPCYRTDAGAARIQQRQQALRWTRVPVPCPRTLQPSSVLLVRHGICILSSETTETRGRNMMFPFVVPICQQSLTTCAPQEKRRYGVQGISNVAFQGLVLPVRSLLSQHHTSGPRCPHCYSLICSHPGLVALSISSRLTCPADEDVYRPAPPRHDSNNLVIDY
jgi:hypothetical protein